MLAKLKKLFSRPEVSATPAPLEQDDLHLAACALMVEAACLDGEFDAGERAAMLDLIQTQFGIERAEGESLIAEAEAAQAGSSGLLPFTRVIKERCDEEQRIEVIEMLWGVAYADGRLHDFEANLLRRVGGLIYVSDRAIGEARKRVLSRMGLAG